MQEDYIREQLGRGFSKEQIRDVLLRSGYADAAIDQAFAGVEREQLRAYVHSCTQGGYNREQIRARLLQQGYPMHVVDEALGRNARPFIILAVMLLVICVVGGLLLLPSKQSLLDFSVEQRTQDSHDYLPGGQVEFMVHLQGMGNGRFDVLLTYELLDGQQVLDRKQETLAVDTSLEVIRTLSLPRSIISGSYAVHVTARYGTQTATSAYVFTIPEPPAADAVHEKVDSVVECGSSCQTRAAIVPSSAACADLLLPERDACYSSFMEEGDFTVCNKFSTKELVKACSRMFYEKMRGLS